jgi:hypothetical protein
MIEDVGKIKSKRLATNAFNLWNKYASKISDVELAQEVVKLGERLLQAKEFSIARDVCYGWLLVKHGVMKNDTCGDVDCFAFTEKGLLNSLLVASNGYCLAMYHQLTGRAIDKQVLSRGTLALGLVERVMRTADKQEELLPILRDGNVILYKFSVLLMRAGQHRRVLDYLLLGTSTMESCISLMTPTHLPLRTGLHCAVCNCYFALGEPNSAETCARRALSKVGELVQLQNKSTTPQTTQSERAYKEAAVKLGMIVFRRTVFESRKKTRSILRNKARPPLKDILSSPWPRSPSEKLLSEMFTGRSACFQAILTALEDPSCRGTEPSPPHPTHTDLDADTYLEVHQELATAGADVAVKCLCGDGLEGKDSVCSINPHLTMEGSLMDMSVQGEDTVPISSIVQFLHLLRSYCYTEAYGLIYDQLHCILKECDALPLKCHQKVLEVVKRMDYLKQLKVDTKFVSPETSSAFVGELVDTAGLLASCLDLPIAESECELLRRSSLFVWELSLLFFKGVTSYRTQGCSSIGDHPLRKELLGLLSLLHQLLTHLNTWSTDPLVVGEVTLKLIYILENRASLLKPDLSGYDLSGVDKNLLRCLSFDRSVLLEAARVAEVGLRGVDVARTLLHASDDSAARSSAELLHVELLSCSLRLKVKLCHTLPPDLSTHTKSNKASSLKNKVEEQNRLELRQSKLLALITAPGAKIATRDEVHSECGRNSFLSSLLLMQEVVVSRDIDQEEDASRCTANLQQALGLLHGLPLTVPRWRRGAGECKDLVEGVCPPPPTLIGQSDTSMTFKPSAFNPPPNSKVVWYALYGRRASGSNVKVRLNDSNLPGLGIPVPVGEDCQLTVSGLQANETYVFAVAGYTQDGCLVGDSIGETGKPILSTHSLPALAGYTRLCKFAYDVGSLEVAMTAGDVVWSYFVEEVKEDLSGGTGLVEYRLKSSVVSITSPQLLWMLIKCVFILVDVHVQQESISSTHLEWSTVPHRQQARRLTLCRMLMVAMEVGKPLEDHDVILQSVVTCYRILCPLIQHNLMTDSLGEIVQKCLHALKELPKETLSSCPSQRKEQVHHMIAVMAYQGLKILHHSPSRSMVGPLVGSVKELLAATLVPPKTPALGGHLPGLEKTPTKKNTFTHSAGTSQPLSGSAQIRRVKTAELKSVKRRGKRATANTTSIPEEMKSEDMRALEAYFAKWRVEAQEQVLTGQEDIMLLHKTIATEHATLAYKEVRKFRKRPRYLEFFVHLCSRAVKSGHFDDTVEWSQEVFSWLKRRNELLMQPKVPRVTRREPTTLSGEQTRYSMAVQKYTEKPKSHIMRHHTRLSVMSMETLTQKVRGKKGEPHTKEDHSPPQRTVDPHEEGKLVPLKPDLSKAMLLSYGPVSISRDDLLLKAKSVLSTLLTDTYRHSVKRKRLRTVTIGEYPWRAQLHLILAHSRLDRLSSQLRPYLLSGSGNGGTLTPSLLLYPNTGTLLHGLLGNIEEVGKETSSQRRREEVVDLQGTAHKLSTIREVPSQINTHPRDGGGQEVALDGEKQEVRGTQEEGKLKEKQMVTFDREDNFQLSSSKGKNITDKSSKRSQEKERSLPPEIASLPDIILDFRKAIVLSHRGQLWVLLQNVCRDLYSSLTNLTNLFYTCTNLPSSTSADLTAHLHSLSSRTLHMGSQALLDMLHTLQLSGVDLSQQFPDVDSGYSADVFVSPFPVDLEFVVRFVLLTLHVLLKSSLWERLVDVCCTFNPITCYKYADKTVPLLKHAEQELMVRTTANRFTRKVQSLHPAAHLDPAGYNIYGSHGDGLGLTNLHVNPSGLHDKLAQTQSSSSSGPKKSLGRSRETLARVLKHEFLPDRGIPVPPEVSSLDSRSLHCVVESYNTAVGDLKGEKEWFLSSIALHELGMVHWYQDDIKTARSCWTEGLNVVLRSNDAGKMRKTIFKSHRTALEKFGYQSLWSAIVLVGKLVKFVYVNELDIRLEHALLAMNAIKSLLSASLTDCRDDLSFLLLPTGESDPIGPTLFPSGGDLFGLTRRCVLDSLHCVAKILVQRKFYDESLPVLYLYERFSFSACRSAEHCVRCGVLTVQATTGLHLFSQAIARMKALLTGTHLPHDHTHSTRPLESHGHGKAYYNDSQPATDLRNFKTIAHLLEKQLPPGLSLLYGPHLVHKLSLCRARLYIALASRLPGLPSLSALRKGTSEVSRPPTALSSFIDSQMDRASSPGSSVTDGREENHTSQTTSQSTENEFLVPPTGEIKSTLLHHAETLILSVASQVEGGDVSVVVQCHLCLSELGLAMHTPTVAANSALAALRLIQENGNENGNKEPVHDRVGPLMWLECRQMLAWSLLHLHTHPHPPSSPLSLSTVCSEGISEATSSGMPEVVAWFNWCLAVHNMTHSPSDTSRSISLLEACLQSYEQSTLTSHSRLVRSEVSFHLASLLLSVSGWSDPDPSIVDVCRGVISYLSSEVKRLQGPSHMRTPSHSNTYLPHLELLARCQLLVGRCLLAGQQHSDSVAVLKEGLDNCRLSSKRWKVLEAQLLCNLSEAVMHISKDNITPLDYLQPAVWMSEIISLASKTNSLHILCESTLALMAGMFCSRSTTPTPLPLPPPSSSSDKRPKATPHEKERPTLVPSRDGKEGERSTSSSSGVDHRPDNRQWQKERNIDSVVCWSCLQALRLTQQARKRLEDSTQELGRQELNKTISSKAMDELSDGIILSLTEGDHSFATLTARGTAPVAELTPSNLYTPSTSTTWRKVLVHLSELRRRVYPHTQGHTSAWCSPPLAGWWADECDCLHKILTDNLPSVYEECTPPLLPRLVVDHFTKLSTKHQVSPPGTALLVPTQAQVEKWYTTAEPQVNVHWDSSLLSSSQTRGIFTINLKPVKHLSSFTMASTSEMHVFPITGDQTRFCLLRQALSVCAERAKEASVSKQSAHSQKSSLSKHPLPTEIQAMLMDALGDLCDMCDRKLVKTHCPSIPVEALSQLSSILEWSSRVLQARKDVCTLLSMVAKATPQHNVLTH